MKDEMLKVLVFLQFHIPDLRVGTLDSLLALSDDLTKANSVVEGVTHKVKRQIDELERVAIADSSALAVDGVPIDSYVTRFQSEKPNSSLILISSHLTTP
jgi:hypothetical protein